DIMIRKLICFSLAIACLSFCAPSTDAQVNPNGRITYARVGLPNQNLDFEALAAGVVGPTFTGWYPGSIAELHMDEVVADTIFTNGTTGFAGILEGDEILPLVGTGPGGIPFLRHGVNFEIQQTFVSNTRSSPTYILDTVYVPFPTDVSAGLRFFGYTSNPGVFFGRPVVNLSVKMGIGWSNSTQTGKNIKIEYRVNNGAWRDVSHVEGTVVAESERAGYDVVDLEIDNVPAGWNLATLQFRTVIQCAGGNIESDPFGEIDNP
ncbi:MAG: hypothetical protein AAF456_25990, partial [Planctomycetota bacterium]